MHLQSLSQYWDCVIKIIFSHHIRAYKGYQYRPASLFGHHRAHTCAKKANLSRNRFETYPEGHLPIKKNRNYLK